MSEKPAVASDQYARKFLKLCRILCRKKQQSEETCGNAGFEVVLEKQIVFKQMTRVVMLCSGDLLDYESGGRAFESLWARHGRLGVYPEPDALCSYIVGQIYRNGCVARDR